MEEHMMTWQSSNASYQSRPTTMPLVALSQLHSVRVHSIALAQFPASGTTAQLVIDSQLIWQVSTIRCLLRKLSSQHLGRSQQTTTPQCLVDNTLERLTGSTFYLATGLEV